MSALKRLFQRFSRAARRRRAAVFAASFELEPTTRILDLGGGDGSHLHSILQGTKVKPANVFIADIDRRALDKAQRRYGFTPLLLDETGSLPLPTGYFDIVYCSSVIEHVTIPKERVWHVRSDSEFRNAARAHQQLFAREICRLGRQYFVQTPHRRFPIESHSWLPFAGHLPRRALLGLLRRTNRFWVKQTQPDWHLLDARELAELFPEATIVQERSLGMTKSLMAIKTSAQARAPRVRGRAVRVPATGDTDSRAAVGDTPGIAPGA